jgi:hypothetical protein
MNTLRRWIAFASFAAVLVLAGPARAFTDSNAELKEAAGDRAARVVVQGKAAPPVRTVWVPTSAKKLDGFKPVLPPEAPSTAQTLAKAELPAAIKR